MQVELLAGCCILRVIAPTGLTTWSETAVCPYLMPQTRNLMTKGEMLFERDSWKLNAESPLELDRGAGSITDEEFRKMHTLRAKTIAY